MVLFVFFIDRRQEQFISEFKTQTIQMDDFSIKIKGLPRDDQFDNNEHLLKARLWEFLTNMLATNPKC